MGLGLFLSSPFLVWVLFMQYSFSFLCASVAGVGIFFVKAAALLSIARELSGQIKKTKGPLSVLCGKVLLYLGPLPMQRGQLVL